MTTASASPEIAAPVLHADVGKPKSAQDPKDPSAVPMPVYTTSLAPFSPQYHPYGWGGRVDSIPFGKVSDPMNYGRNEPFQYPPHVFPVTPQFPPSFPDGGYHSYPGSPALHPQPPPGNVTSPPFSPPFLYPSAGGNPHPSVALSPPVHTTYVLPPQLSPQQFPAFQVASPSVGPLGGCIPGTDRLLHKQPTPDHFSLSDAQRGPGSRSKHHLSQQPKSPDPEQSQSLNVYVRGLEENMTDQLLYQLCIPYGCVISCKAMMNQKTGKCKGYGFAMYASKEECDNAIEGLNSKGFRAAFARVGQESFSLRLKHLQDETSTNIYISNLPLDMTEPNLEALFAPYKTLSSRILRDQSSDMSRGVGFARMEDRASALAIIDKFNGVTIPGSSSPLQVRFADSPAQKKLKHQTTQNAVVQPVAHYQPMPSFGTGYIGPMPITPETMLGIVQVNPPQPTLQSLQYVHLHHIYPPVSVMMPRSVANGNRFHCNPLPVMRGAIKITGNTSFEKKQPIVDGDIKV